MSVRDDIKAHTGAVYRLAFSPDGGRLVSSGGDRRVVLHSLRALQKEQEWPGSQFIAPVAFSPDGRYIGAGGYAIRVWEIGATDGAGTPLPPVIDSKEWADSCAFSPEGEVFAAFGAERAIQRWAIPSGAALPGGWGGTRASNHNRRFPTGGMAFRPDGAIVASVHGVLGQRGFDSVVHLWDAASGELVDVWEIRFSYAHPQVLDFSPDGTLLAAETGPILHIWDIAARREIAAWKASVSHIKDFVFTPDGTRILVVHNGGELRFWNIAAGREDTPMSPEIGKLTAVAVSGQGRIAIGSGSGRVAVYERGLI